MSLIHDSADAPDDAIDEIVATCIESDPALLDSTVSKACEDNPEHALEIRTRIEALRAVGLVRPTGVTSDGGFPERLAEFQLIERLGGGGMGVVFRARQDPLGREVALKLIRPEHLYFPRARERFQRETGAVARLQHPGIVPIYTVGEDRGVPFFAMELIAGCTLGEGIARLRPRAPETLTGRDLERAIRDALAPWARTRAPDHNVFFARSYVTCIVTLIANVAGALDHAHARGVLHRDVKPSNIAVTLEGRALLFDFGLADLADRPAQLTASHAEIGSLLYMSPEHLGRDGSELDARSDVYSLGVSLYELLALQPPFFDPDPERTRRAILDGQPDSLRARNRAVPRELEIVCFKAMDRERERRYASASAFARDLSNVLEHRPIEARPPSTSLRVRRWVQRHPTTSVAIGAGALTLVGLPLALYLQQRVHAGELRSALEDTQAQSELARREARTASETSRFLRDLFTWADPNNARGGEVTVREVLDDGASRLEHELVDQPLVRASLYDSIGQSYLSLGEYERAEPLLLRALALREQSGGVESLETADSLSTLSQLERTLGQPSALEHARRAVELRRKLATEPELETVKCLNAYGMALQAVRKLREACDVYGEALALADRLPSERRRARAVVIGNLARALYDDEHYEAAIEAARESTAIERELFGDLHPGIAASDAVVADALTRLKRFDEARAVYERILELERQRGGESSERYAVFLNNYGRALSDAGDFEAAREKCERALAILDEVATPTNRNALICRQGLALMLARNARWSDAREDFADLVTALDDAHGLATARGWLARTWLAWCREALGDLEGARREVEHALEGGANEDALDWQAVARAQLARWNAARGDLDVAREQADLALARRADASSSAVDQWSLIAAGCVAQARGDSAAAIAEFEKLAGIEMGAEHARWTPALARARLAALIAPTDEARAVALAERAAQELVKRLGAEHPEARAAAATLDALRARLVK